MPHQPDLPRELAALKLLVFYDKPETVLPTLSEKFPGLDVAVCTNFDGLAEAIDREQPNVLLAYKFRRTPFPRAAAVESPSIKWLHNSGIGVDHFMPWDPGKITLTISKSNQGEVMGQFTMCRILMFAMRVPTMLTHQRAHKWERIGQQVVTGKTHTIVGFGMIGREMARLSKAFGMRVVGVNRSGVFDDAADAVYSVDRIHEALAEGDFVTIVLPLTKGTLRLIDADCFAAMKPGAVLINVGRGKIVDEEPMISALKDGRLAGAALDVFSQEPLPKGHELWDMKNVLISSHNSAALEGWQSRGLDPFCVNLEVWLSGGKLAHIVDPARGY